MGALGKLSFLKETKVFSHFSLCFENLLRKCFCNQSKSIRINGRKEKN